MVDKVLIFDTTLRDGEQSPGVALTAEDKLEIARQLEKLGVDIIEAGFPASSQGDLEGVAGVARAVREPVIAALAHAHPDAVDAAWEGVKDAARPRIHVFLSSSEIHMLHQLRKERDEASRERLATLEKELGEVTVEHEAMRDRWDEEVRQVRSIQECNRAI